MCINEKGSDVVRSQVRLTAYPRHTDRNGFQTYKMF